MRRWLRRVRKYVVTLTMGILIALFLGAIIFWLSPHGGLSSWMTPLPWLAFSLALGALTLWVLLLPAAAGPLARLIVAMIASTAVFIYVEKGSQGGPFDKFGQLGFLVKPISTWLANSGLDNFDSVLWRVSLLGGLAALAAYPLFRASLGWMLTSVGKVVSAQWQSLYGTDDDPDELAGEEERLAISNFNFFTNLTTRHAMLGLTTVSVMLVVLMLPVLQALEDLANSGGWQFIRVLESGERVIWVAPLIIILELTAVSLRNIPWNRIAATAPARPQPDEPVVPRINELFDRLLSIAGNSVILFNPKDGERAAAPPQTVPAGRLRRRRGTSNGPAARVVEGMRRVSKVDPGRLGQISGPLDQFLDTNDSRGAKRLAIAEAMTADHYLLCAHLISHVLDDGGTFLVVAPDDLLPDVRTSLTEALSVCGVKFAISEFEITSFSPPESELFNLIFVRESFLHRGLLNNSKHYSGFLERLRLIFLLEAADMDLGWLRLRLLSLWQMANYQHARIVMQSSSSVRLTEIIGLVATVGGSADVVPIAMAQASARATHVLMYDDTDDLRETMRPEVTSEVRHAVSAPVMLALEALLHDCEPIVYKTNLDPPEVVQVESNWLDDVISLVRHQEDLDEFHRNSGALEALNYLPFRTHLRTTDAPATVIAWDTYNFLAVKDRNYNYFRAKDFLVQILSKPYPMRDFLRMYDEDPGGSDRDKRIIFLPHAPRLAGGLAELAFVTVEAMSRGKGLTRSQFKAILATVPRGDFLQSAGIGNDASGIERLLELHGVANRFRVEPGTDPLTGERVFKSSGDAASLRPQTLVLQNGIPIDDADLDYHDRGLTYGVQTRIRIRNKIWTVTGIDPYIVRLSTPSNTRMLNYVFVNAYRFNSDAIPIVESTHIDRQTGSDFGRALLHASFSRTTEQIYDYPSGDDPFVDGRSPALSSVAGQPWTRVDRNLKCVAHLVLTGFSGIVPTGASPPGQPSMSRELSRAAVALATCTIIKDTISSLFPDAAPRISVLSNQLGSMRKLLDQRSEELEAATKSKPLGRQQLDQIKHTNFLAGRVGYLSQPEPRLLRTWISAFPGDPPDPDDILEIFVVEDSEWDLGVARAIIENDDILKAAASFCEVITDDEEVGGEGTYLRFGADMALSFVHLRGANQILSRFDRADARTVPPASEGAAS